MVKSRKHPFTLLEVMIAFLIIIAAFYPLISPHAAILKEQRLFIDKIELDHLVSLIYADVIEGLYQNRYEWGGIKQGTRFPVDQALLERVGYTKKLPYKGYYSFSINKFKPKIKPEDPPEEKITKLIYLLDLNFDFTHNRTSQEQTYQYQVVIIRDIDYGTGFMEREE